jgi:hypothetical protein
MSSRNLSPTVGTALAALLLVALSVVLVALAPAVASAEEACPNAALRFGPSANLPDCRAYELVTPAVKEDNNFIFAPFGFADGEHVYFDSVLPLPGAKNGQQTASLSSRTPQGWITTTLTLPQTSGFLEANKNSSFDVSFTSDFSAAFIQSTFTDDPRDQNVDSDDYRMEIPSGRVSLESLPDTGPMTEELYAPPPGFTSQPENVSQGSYPAGNSADGSHVLFETQSHLPTAPGTPVDTHLSGNELYERHDEHTYLVGILPDGSVPLCGAEIGDGARSPADPGAGPEAYGAVSPDGSNVVFHTDGAGNPRLPGCEQTIDQQGYKDVGGLYLREDNGTPQAKTVELPGKFYLGRTADGSTVLSDGPGGNGEGEPIYEYNVPTGQVTTVGYGALLAYSADGSVVYYVTNLTNGFAKVTSESQIKVYDHGVTKTLSGAGAEYAGGLYKPAEPTGGEEFENLPTTTPDGSKLLFLDRADLAGYDTYGPTCADNSRSEIAPGHCSEAYIYDLNSGSFTCASCNPNGAPPLSNTSLFEAHRDPFLPATPPLLSEDGSRAFFQTAEALVPQDTSGVSQVYEWENGHIYLISSGQGGEIGVQHYGTEGYGFAGFAGSELVGASANGDDVFIKTADRLAPQDEESSTAIYDVRVDGGFPYHPVGHGCDSGQCQGPQTPAPVFAPPPSSTFVGVGNPAWETSEPVAKAKTVAHPAKKRKAKKRGRRKGTTGKKAKGRK